MEKFQFDPARLPKHIGIIMDGNGRWAKKRGLPRTFGHREGAKVFRKIVEYCGDIGLEYLTVYAFSTENWSRPKDEVDSIMKLLEQYIDDAFVHQDENQKFRTKFIGDISALSSVLQEKIRRIEEVVSNKNGLMVNIALNYGGRDEIVRAAKQVAHQVQTGALPLEKMDQETFSQYLYTAGQPDPDLIIRPSGEERLSNFLIWQAAYSEFVFMDILWPDFTPRDLERAIVEYQQRDRRFGGV